MINERGTRLWTLGDGIDTDYPVYLNDNQIQQHSDSGNVWRFVNLPDLKKNLPTKGNGKQVEEIVNYVNGEASSFYLRVRKNGALTIGCQRFTVAATKHIFKAMGLRRTVGTKPKTAKPVKLKARAAAAKRKKH